MAVPFPLYQCNTNLLKIFFILLSTVGDAKHMFCIQNMVPFSTVTNWFSSFFENLLATDETKNLWMKHNTHKETTVIPKLNDKMQMI